MPNTLLDLLNNARTKHQDIPVPVVAIAKELGLDIYETEDFDDDQSGSIRKEGKHYVIYVNDRHAPVRKRFTIAHEIGHYVLHKDEIDRRHELVDTIKQPSDAALHRVHNKKQNQADYQREREANQLAADILMPEKDFVESWQEAEKIEDLATAYQVSPSAATVRANELFGLFMT